MVELFMGDWTEIIKNKIDEFISLLKQSPQIENIFNPWREVDIENDIDSKAPKIRTNQMRHYLLSRLKKARYLLIGEALGYQGGHFSGIAMTSERILLGYLQKEGINPHDVLPDLEPRRSSRPEIMSKGFSEPTATIVWGTLLKFGLKPDEFVLWNVFPWHPFDRRRGILSNRRPTERELRYGYPVLEKFFELFPGRIVIALGKISASVLKSMKINFYEVRHPANAGAQKFRKQIYEILRKTYKN
ncbi:MAG: uracil-DNA glycosylase [Nitrospirota bacterium]